MNELMSRWRVALAACMLVACLALVACGGDDDKDSADSSDTTEQTTAADETATTEEAPPPDEAPAEDDFVAQGNEICSTAFAEADQLGSSGDLGGAISRLDQMVTELSELTPPEDQQETFDALIEGARAQVTESMRIVEDGGTAEDLSNLDDSEIDALATELGLDACAA